ncbi:MAG TPA: HAD family hydrolase [Oligoflexus sp.]|uniref:HAD family hydrolase n=1 Tax=Oligoflexus sp. TaxID=1971216 RepID=UPI002D7E3AAE|nr:HAD family hydrolase [Oligoflexus sp.]HET9238677.1 HAD family hydrolase [Oligoflexus sp.]
MNAKALIFDCDGTLTDSLGQALESFHYALDRLGEPRSTPDVIRYFGVSADRILFNLLGDAARAQKAYEFYKEQQTRLAPGTLVYPGVTALLEKARKASVPMAVVTGRHRQDLEILLQPLGLLDFFSVIVTDNELAEPKPSPEGLFKALQLLGLKDGSQSFYIGDSLTDMQAAHAAGMKPIAALWDSKVAREKLLNAQPYALAEHPDDVWTTFMAQV